MTTTYETNRDYEQIERPYDSLLQRSVSTNVSGQTAADQAASDAASTGESIAGSSAPTGGSSSANGSVETMPVRSDGAIGDVWIKNFIRSENWKPKSVGFTIDGQSGYAEFCNVFVSGNIEALTGSVGGFQIGSDYVRDTADSFGLSSTVTEGNDVRLWAGATFADRENAPFRVYQDGSIAGTGLTITKIDLPNTTTVDSFHVDVDGNAWWGSILITDATAKIMNTGAATFSNVVITGGIVSTNTLSGIIPQGNLNIADRGWSQTCIFSILFFSPSSSTSPSASMSPSRSQSASTSPSRSTSPSASLSPSRSQSMSPSASLSPSKSLSPSLSQSLSLSPSSSYSPSSSLSNSPSSSLSPSSSMSPSRSTSPSASLSPSFPVDVDTVGWSSGVFTSADSTVYNISRGDTGNMSAKTYIYFRPGSGAGESNTTYQTTTTPTNAVGAGRVLIAVAESGTTEPTFQVLNGQGGQKIEGSDIVAGSVTANEIAASSITAGKINVSELSAISANMGSINAGSLNINAGVASINSAGAAVFKSIQVGGADVQYGMTNNGIFSFGDGSDGYFVTTGDVTLTSDKYYTNLTIQSGHTLFPNGYRIFCSGTLTLNGTISRNGNAGTAGINNNGSSVTIGTGGAALSDGYLKGSVRGGNGGSNVLSGYPTYPENGISVTNSIGVSGASGGANPSSGGSGGGGGGATPSNAKLIANWHLATLLDITSTGSTIKYENSGGSGGGGYGHWGSSPNPWNAGNAGAGGGGGSGGGIIAIYARNIVIGSTYGGNLHDIKLPKTATNDTSIYPENLWRYVDRILTADGNYPEAIGASPTCYLKTTNFGFNVPANLTILGIRAVYYVVGMGYGGTSVAANAVRLVKGGAVSGNVKTGTLYAEWNNGYTSYFGGSDDLWGQTWTPSDINSSNFGVAVSASWNATYTSGAMIDYVKIEIYTSGGVVTANGGNGGDGSPGGDGINSNWPQAGGGGGGVGGGGGNGGQVILVYNTLLNNGVIAASGGGGGNGGIGGWNKDANYPLYSVGRGAPGNSGSNGNAGMIRQFQISL